MHQFSIVTPTFNRSKYLPRIYECLSQQGEIDFEWIIVDDGSSDNTKEVVESFNKSFEIKYIYQENGGQLSARNTGTKNANSYIIAKVDDDDLLLPNVLKKVWNYFDIESERFENNCVCLSGLFQYDTGEINGGKFPHDYYVSDHIRYRLNKYSRGDKYEFYVTEIFKKYPFPVIKGEKNLSPHIVQIWLALSYKTLYINQIFGIKNNIIGGLSSQRYMDKYPLGSELFYNEATIPPFRLRLQMHNSSRYIYYARINKKIFRTIYKNAKNRLIYPLGLCRYYLILFKMFLERYQLFNSLFIMLFKEKNKIRKYKPQ